MRIFFVYRSARKSLYNSYHEHQSPSTFLYGLVELQKLGMKAMFSDNAYHPLNFLNYLLKPLENYHQKLLRYSIGFKLHQALILLPQLLKSEVIITTQDSAGLPILLLKRLHLISVPMIYISNGLVNALTNLANRKMKNFVIQNLLAADIIVCYSKHEQKKLEEFTHKKVAFIPFGIDTDFYKPEKSALSIDILSVGRDSFRDYKTLFKSVTNTKFKVVVVCDPDNIKTLTIPANVTIMHRVTPLELKALYNKSKLVVIPLKNNDKPQGQVVFLESIAMNKRIIISAIPGITQGFDFQKFSNYYFVKPNNPQELRTKINTYLHKQQRFPYNQSVRSYISMQRFAKEIMSIIEKLVV